MSNTLAEVAVALSILTALGTLYHGWQRRLEDAARRPFLAGQAAVEEAETALRLKDARLNALTASEADLLSKLASVQATAAAQQEQMVVLESKLYKAESANRDLLERAEASERGYKEARERIAQLEEGMEELKRKLSLGGGF